MAGFINNLTRQNFITFTGISNIPQSVSAVKNNQNNITTILSPLQEDTFSKSAQDSKTVSNKPKTLDYLEALDYQSQIKIMHARLKKNSRRDLEKLSTDELVNLCTMKIQSDRQDEKKPSYSDLNRAINLKINKDKKEQKLSIQELTAFLKQKCMISGYSGIRDEYSDEIIKSVISLIENSDTFNAKDYEGFLECTKNLGLNETNNRLLSTISQKLHENGCARYDKHLQTLTECFDIDGITLSGRIKSQDSILRKLKNRFLKTSNNNAYDIVPDICAYRLTSDGSREKLEEIIAALEKAIDDGKLFPYSVINHGKPELQYLTQDQNECLQNKGFEIFQKKHGNFICTNIRLMDKDKNYFELQIIGDKMNELNVNEHGFYKMDTPEGEKFKSIPFSLLDKYDNYIKNCYEYVRQCELGLEAEKPKLPDGIQENLNLI